MSESKPAEVECPTCGRIQTGTINDCCEQRGGERGYGEHYTVEAAK